MVTLLIVMLIRDVVNSAGVERIVWTATTLTGGILLDCVTIMGFAAAEEDAERRRIADESGDYGSHLNDALTRAKEESSR